MRIIADPGVRTTLADYAAVANLLHAVTALRAVAEAALPRLRDRTVWMVNSAAQGGGVAELLPAQLSLLRELGVDARWAVIESRTPAFFAFTKRLHNLIHDVAEPHPTAADRAMYDAVNAENAELLAAHLKPHDIVVVHDPQPAGLARILKGRQGATLRTLWRSHIGLARETSHTRAAWEFLRPDVEAYDRAVFTLADYVPEWLRARAAIIHPSIDPLSHKNRDLSLHKLVGIMSDAGLVTPNWPLLEPPFADSARRLQEDGSFAPATVPEEIGLLGRPIVTQVSRWDGLKGFEPLLDAFVILKADRDAPTRDHRHRRRVEEVRLILAGPDPTGIADDPEGVEVLRELTRRYVALPAALQRDIAIVTLPMVSRKDNALMVNVVQRASDIVLQNSLQEGFGLTVAEAMWKRIPVLGSGSASGIQLQVRDGVDGRLVDDPEDTRSIAALLREMLADSDRLEEWGRSAQRRVHDEFLVLRELVRWLELLPGPDAR